MAQIRADEITRVLREEIENYERAVSVSETGFVISVGDGIARIHGLETVMAGELIEFPHNVSGIALEPGRRSGGRGVARRLHKDQRRRRSPPNRSNHVGAGRRGADRTRGGCAGQADRRSRSDRHEQFNPLERWLPASSTASRSRSRCRRVSKRSTR